MGKKTKFYGDCPATSDEQRAVVSQFYDFRFPHLKQIEDLRKDLALIRGEAMELERRGAPEAELIALKADAVRLSGQIERLVKLGGPGWAAEPGE